LPPGREDAWRGANPCMRLAQAALRRVLGNCRTQIYERVFKRAAS